MNYRGFFVVLFLLSLVLLPFQTNAVTTKVVEINDQKQEEGVDHSPIKVASIQYNPTSKKPNKNIKELYREFEKAFKNGAKLAVAPEMATTGYMFENREDIAPFVEQIPGPTTKIFRKLAAEYDSYIVFGMPEKDADSNLYYNSSVLIGPEGLVGKYRKMHLWETDAYWAARGDAEVEVYDTELGKVAMNICMDSAYYETARTAAVKGADILAFPTNSSAQTISALPARAQQNGLYILSANRSNTEKGFHMVGASAIWSPHGEKLAEAPYSPDAENDINETKTIYGYVNPDHYRNENKEMLGERRPELYKELSQFIQPWDSRASTESQRVNAMALQYSPILGDKKANQKKVHRLIEEEISKAKDTDLIVLPELSFTGPVTGKSINTIYSLSERDKGKTFSFMSKLAKKHKVNIVYGVIERENNQLYNSAILLNEKGEWKGKYRKTHLDNEEKRWATPGDSLPVFNVEGLGKIGLLIGDDVRFPESSGVLSSKRADMIAVPVSWSGEYSGYMEINPNLSENQYPDNAVVLWDAVAIGAQAYTIFANFVGSEQGFKGSSGLYTLDPLYGLDQPVTGSSKHEEAVTFELNTIQAEHWFNQEKLLQSRHPLYYEPLIQNQNIIQNSAEAK
ncbi:Predicted amidohydrolase [Halobacillus karajensis]|uniref:nitrilase-related carbon-nitrogen hydrolase n=1 Tax=Halobacillus karajensis TaxID=195088 RepID=UPI0008A7EB20|nr:nitrilase-related carbon-nitrogen hydrolase [Halobacillus karajensis]SEI04457.1 Predicted amidohydrolase [Halobacillus karajensis]